MNSKGVLNRQTACAPWACATSATKFASAVVDTGARLTNRPKARARGDLSRKRKRGRIVRPAPSRFRLELGSLRHQANRAMIILRKDNGRESAPVPLFERSHLQTEASVVDGVKTVRLPDNGGKPITM